MLLTEITEMLHEYPRVKDSFTVRTEYNLSRHEERRKLIKIVKTNLRNTTNL